MFWYTSVTQNPQMRAGRTPCMARVNGAGLAPSVFDWYSADRAPCPYCATKALEYLSGHGAFLWKTDSHA